MRPALADDLSLTLEEAWSRLTGGVRDRRSPFHTPAIATIGLDGRPRMRTVVLRGADAGQGVLRFHTDLRGGKVAEIR
jgi:pyridoxamine 5'-phosphate oxidase